MDFLDHDLVISISSVVVCKVEVFKKNLRNEPCVFEVVGGGGGAVSDLKSRIMPLQVEFR